VSRLGRFAGLAWVAVAFAAIVALAACSSATAPSSGPALTAGPDSPRVVAKDLAFTTPTVAVPAERAFALVFDNQEAAPHNVAIDGPDGKRLMEGEVFTGPGQRVYQVPALAPGTYKFICSVHPNMVGELTAQ
jgi:plastocyanin